MSFNRPNNEVESTGISNRSNGTRDCPEPPSPPISMLHDDILWRIFTLNTPTDADIIESPISIPETSLPTAIHTSQVCSRWRNLILSFPSLWANIINLSYLDQKNDSWRNEILKRTGSSLLSVIGCLLDGRPVTAFFLTLLRDHWTRLRRVCVQVENGENGVFNNDESWLSLRLPAPNLEIFGLMFPSPPAFSTTDEVLFSSDAPSIHTLTMHQVNFNLSGVWLSQIRHLNLYGRSFEMTTLFALADMQSLEVLALSGIKLNRYNPQLVGRDWPAVILPSLRFLSLSADITALTFLLGHIAPTSGCISKIESINGILPFRSTEFMSFLDQSFTIHFRSFLEFAGNKTISWALTDTTLNLTMNLNQDSGCYDFSFRLDIYASGVGLLQGTPYFIFTSLYSCNLGSVDTFVLDIGRASLNPSNPHVTRFFRSLTSVTNIYTDSESLELVLQAKEHSGPSTLFPALRTIIFDTDSDLKSDIIMRFLMWRRDAGVPITKFDLSNCMSTKQERLLFLEGLDGLDVVWNERIRSEI